MHSNSVNTYPICVYRFNKYTNKNSDFLLRS